MEYESVEIVGTNGISAFFRVTEEKLEGARAALKDSMSPYQKYIKEVLVESEDCDWYNVWIAVK